MSYGTLTEGRDYLGGFKVPAGKTSLYPETVTAAESHADMWIDSNFAEWDRSTWSATHAPAEVSTMWRMVASADYIRRRALANTPDADRSPIVSSLLDDAQRMLDSALSRGWLIGTAGEKIYAAGKDDDDGGTSSGRLIR